MRQACHRRRTRGFRPPPPPSPQPRPSPAAPGPGVTVSGRGSRCQSLELAAPSLARLAALLGANQSLEFLAREDRSTSDPPLRSHRAPRLARHHLLRAENVCRPKDFLASRQRLDLRRIRPDARARHRRPLDTLLRSQRCQQIPRRPLRSPFRCARDAPPHRSPSPARPSPRRSHAQEGSERGLGHVPASPLPESGRERPGLSHCLPQQPAAHPKNSDQAVK